MIIFGRPSSLIGLGQPRGALNAPGWPALEDAANAWWQAAPLADQQPWFVLDAIHNRAMLRTGVAGGTDAVTNGDFSLDPVNASPATNQNGWQWGRSGGSAIPTWVAGTVTLQADGTNTLYFRGANTGFDTTAGVLYEARITLGTNGAYIAVGTSSGGNQIVTDTFQSTGTSVVRFIARGSKSYIQFSKTANNVTTLTSFSLKAVLPSTVVSGTPEQLIAAGYLTYSRSDAYATRESAAGVWEQVAANTLRRKYDGSIYIEPSVTNSVRNPRCVGASAPSTLPTYWSTGGFTGVTVSVEGTGTENGIDYVDIRMVSASTGGTFGVIFLDASQIAAALNTEVWSALIFKKLSSGSLSNIDSMSLQLRQQDSGGTGLGDLVASSFTPTSSLTSSSGTVTCDQASTAYLRPFIGVYWNAGVAIDLTLRVGWPQEQKSGVITTPIVPAVGGTGATTRAADAFDLPTADLYMTGDGTIAGEYTTPYATNPASASTPIGYLICVDDTTNARFNIRSHDANIYGTRLVIGDGTTITTSATGGGVAANAVFRCAARYKTSAADGAISGNGAAAVAAARAMAIDFPTAIGLGQRETGGTQMAGTLRYISGLAKVMSNAEIAVESARYS